MRYFKNTTACSGTKNQLLNWLKKSPYRGEKPFIGAEAPFIYSRAHLAGNFFDVFERENE